jgi:hypothetical protein
MTLAYIDEPGLPDLAVVGADLTFSQVSLVVADVRTDFPFDPEGDTDDHMAIARPKRLSRSEIRRRELLLREVKA